MTLVTHLSPPRTEVCPAVPARSSALAPSTRDYLALPLRQRASWVVLLGSMTAVTALTIDLYLPAFPTLQDELATSAARVQLTLTGTLVGLALGQLVVGPLSDALGRRRPLVAGLALHLVASLACAVAPSIAVLGVLRVLQGVGCAAASVVALAVVRDLFDGAGGARLVSRLVLVIGVAPVLAPSVGSYLLAVTSWRGIFVLLAVIAAALWVAALLWLPETLPPALRRPVGVRSSARTYRSLLGDRATLGLVVTAGLTISALFSYVSAAPFVLQELYGLDAQDFALVFAVIGASLVVGTQTTGQLVSRVAPQRLLVTGLVGGLAGALVITALVVTDTGGLAALVVALCATTLFTGVAMPSSPSLVLSRHAWAAGSAAALLGFAQFGIGGAVAPVVGLSGLRGDLAMALAMAAALATALVVHLLVVRPVLNDPPRLRGASSVPPRPAAARVAVRGASR